MKRLRFVSEERRHNRRIPYFLLCLTLLVATGLGQIVRISSPVEVRGGSLTLSDMAAIEPESSHLAGIPLGRAPYAGHYRWVLREEIERALRQWGDDDQVQLDMPERVLVTRRSQVVSSSMLEEAVREFFQRGEGQEGIRVNRVHATGDLVVPEGRVRLLPSPPSSLSNLRNVGIKVDVEIDRALYRSVWARAWLSLSLPVVVATRDIGAGEPLRDGDVRIEQRDLSRGDDYLREASKTLGTVARRRLPRGSPLRERDLRRALLVKRGDLVSLLVQGAGFQVSAVGRAGQNGSIGDTIPIENLQSGQTIRARVVSDKKVEVFLPGANR